MKNDSLGEKTNPLNTQKICCHAFFFPFGLTHEKKKRSHEKCEKILLPLFLCFGFTHEERKGKKKLSHKMFGFACFHT